MSDEQPKHEYIYDLMNDEITVMDILKVLVKFKKIIFLSLILSGVFSVMYGLLSTSMYRANLLMIPAKEVGASNGMQGLGALGGLASLTGISMSDTDIDTASALATLQSYTFTKNFIDENNLMPVLFPERWNISDNNWSRGGSPSFWEAHQRVLKNLLVSTNKNTGIITVSIELSDANSASSWLNKAIAKLNNQLRQRSIEETQRSINFLKEELVTTSSVNIQNVLYNLIEDQTKNIVLANTRDQYAFRVIDPAIVPESRSSPNRKSILIIGLIIGLLLGSLLAFIMHFLEQKKHQL
jgi:uncharacterized protein involved in exopolysaccharide biosynthesis